MIAGRIRCAVPVLVASAALALAVAASPGEARRASLVPTVGGANSPAPSAPPKLVLRTGVLDAGPFAVRVPTGTYTPGKGGAPPYSIPGPIVAFKGADGVWRGHGYLETHFALAKFEGKLAKTSAELNYAFQGGKSYRVKLQVGKGAVLMDEASALGPRNLYVFDCYYGGWLPAAGFALNRSATRHAFLYLPCYYDKAEVTIRPRELSMQPRAGMPAPTATAANARLLDAAAKAADARPAAVAVLSAEPAKRDIAGFFCRSVDEWSSADRMGIQLWQRRQHPGEPASRHFLGPETKSDSTPNPRTAAMLGKSLYEGHVTIEMSLGIGTRKLGFAAAAKPPDKKAIPQAFQKIVRANR